MNLNSLIAVLISFGKIGLISLGGGNSMLKLLEYEAVTYRHWVGQEEFIGMVGTSFLFPGLTGVKLAALIGYKAAGVMGLVLAVAALNIPGLCLTFMGYFWLAGHPSPMSKKIMVSVQYGALALLAAATYSIGEGVMGAYYSFALTLACLLFFLALTFLQLSPIWGFMGFIAICVFFVH
ncbi:MAG: chromate transporter [Legionellales bacterium]|nr:chromate transporter [Legionellales bacterium]